MNQQKERLIFNKPKICYHSHLEEISLIDNFQK